MDRKLLRGRGEGWRHRTNIDAKKKKLSLCRWASVKAQRGEAELPGGRTKDPTKFEDHK